MFDKGKLKATLLKLSLVFFVVFFFCFAKNDLLGTHSDTHTHTPRKLEYLVGFKPLQVSVTIGTAAVFAVVGGYTNDWLGRKPTILLASFVFTTGAVLLGVALNREMLLAGRIIVGMGIGRPISVPAYRVIFRLAPHTHLNKHI